MARTDTLTVTVTLFGQTREVEVTRLHDGNRLISLDRPLVGRFPTGSKVHRSDLVLDRRNANEEHPLRGETAAVVDGEEFVACTVLYTHNRNVGRIYGWYDETVPATHVARW